ncbi:MAG: response regulator [Lachnospiraceae bacterium]|nr:response regulator [Lachnospiraceae bacterium]
MIKVFLVEDEYAIREGIKRSVDWKNNDFELVGEAGDGEMAFPKILKTRPDILITDIRMPFMDGLELAGLVKKEMPDIRIVVLSGYDDFNYAKQAISIGVEEYMLKPVSGEVLMQELKKIAGAIEAKRQEDLSRARYMRDMEEIRELERQKFMHDMIDGRISVTDSFVQGRELGIDITAQFYSIVLFQIFPKAMESGDMAGYSGPCEEIYSRIREAFEDRENVYLYEQVGDVLVFLEKADTASELESGIRHDIGRIGDIMKGFREWIYFIAAGKPVERIRDVNNSYRDASRKFADRYMLDDSCVLYEREDVSLNIGGLDYKVLSQKTILQFLRNGTLMEVDDLVEEYCSGIGEEALSSMMFRQYVLMEALLSALAFLDSLGVDRERAEEIIGDLQDPGRFVGTVEDARSYIRILLNTVIEYRNQMSDKKYTEIIEKAKNFIRDNYKTEDMSLQTVSSYVNVSSNHFSAVFRKETGETFIDYLTRVRMDRAGELLTCTSMKTSEIGFEVGYRDPHYFSYIFKKVWGMSPKEYRRAKK